MLYIQVMVKEGFHKLAGVWLMIPGVSASEGRVASSARCEATCGRSVGHCSLAAARWKRLALSVANWRRVPIGYCCCQSCHVTSRWSVNSLGWSPMHVTTNDARHLPSDIHVSVTQVGRAAVINSHHRSETSKCRLVCGWLDSRDYIFRCQYCSPVCRHSAVSLPVSLVVWERLMYASMMPRAFLVKTATERAERDLMTSVHHHHHHHQQQQQQHGHNTSSAFSLMTSFDQATMDEPMTTYGKLRFICAKRCSLTCIMLAFTFASWELQLRNTIINETSHWILLIWKSHRYRFLR